MKRRNSVLVLVCLFLSACGGHEPSPTSSLTIGCFPSYSTDWSVYLVFWEGTEIAGEKDIGVVSESETVVPDLQIPRTATTIGVYLYDSDSSDPWFFSEIAIVPGATEYANYYWLRYKSFFTYGEIDYGISLDAAVDIGGQGLYEMNFASAPYFLFLDEDTLGEEVRLSFVASGSEVEVTVEEDFATIHHSDMFDYAVSSAASGTREWDGGPVYVLFEPADYGVSTTVQIEHLRSRTLQSNSIDAIVSTRSPELIFAYSQYSGALYAVDGTSATATNLGSVSLYHVGGLAYSDIDQMLYLCNSHDPELVVCSARFATSTVVTLASATKGCCVVALDADRRRLFVTTYEGIDGHTLYILDMDHPETAIASAAIPYASELAFDPSSTSVVGVHGDTVFAVSVADDQIVDSGARFVMPSGSDMYFSMAADGTRLACATPAGHVALLRSSDLSVESSFDCEPVSDQVEDIRLTADGAGIWIADGSYVYRYALSDLSFEARYWIPDAYSGQGWSLVDGPLDSPVTAYLKNGGYRFVYPDPSLRRSLFVSPLRPWSRPTPNEARRLPGR